MRQDAVILPSRSGMPSTRLQAHLALFGVALIYGANYSIAKVVLDDRYIGPSGFILMRVITATALFWIVFRHTGSPRISRRDMGWLALCGLLGVSVNQLLFFGGLERTSPIHASLIMVLTPMLVLLLSVILEGRPFQARLTGGLVMAGAGSVWLVWPGEGAAAGSGDPLGDVMVAGNAVSYAAYLILVRPLMQRYPPMEVLKWVFLFGAMPVLFAGWQEVGAARWADFTLPVALSFGYVLLFTTFFTYLLNAVALRHVAAVTVSAYIYLQPVIATVVALGMGKDRLTISTLASGMMIIAGVWLSVHKSNTLPPR